MRNSGKLLILAMMLVAFVAASASWWVRYSATHRAAQFWGPEAARLIRDAPQVELLFLRRAGIDHNDTARNSAKSSTNSLPPSDELRLGGAVWTIVARRDVSAAHGLVHLRNALLEDRSFKWAKNGHSPEFTWDSALLFRDVESSDSLPVLFTSEFDLLQTLKPGDITPRVISCLPIAPGLAEITAEWSHEQNAQ